MHCSSAGEFEQGKPVIEALKRDYPTHKILVSFFSPSGYGVAANYAFADIITYLPLDTHKNALRFIKAIRPELIIFVKYEFWYHHLSVAAFHHIPVLLISASFRRNQIFFKSYGRFFKNILLFFRQIFVQDEASLNLLRQEAISHVSLSGDTRFDRVKQITAAPREIPFIKDFIGDKKVIVAGSTWSDDEELLQEVISHYPDVKIIIAPHEITESHLRSIEKIFPSTVRYSSLKEQNSSSSNSQVLLIDSVGMLSQLYQYATLTYVGGGFTNDGIHNTLEAAVWGKPVIFGPNYKKYREAKELIAAGGGFSVANAHEIKKLAGHFFLNKNELQAASEKAKNYVLQNAGATSKVLSWIQANRLLTKL